METKICKTCDQEKSIEDFYEAHGYRRGSCKTCVNHRQKEERSRKPEVMKERARRTTLRINHGITLEQFHELWEYQDGACAICEKALSDPQDGFGVDVAYVDHNHQTGAIRGLLCFQCNTGIGHLRDDPEIIRSAAQYVEDDGLDIEIHQDFSRRTRASFRGELCEEEGCEKSHMARGLCATHYSRVYKRETGKFPRECPDCGATVIHTRKGNRDRAEREGRSCFRCSRDDVAERQRKK